VTLWDRTAKLAQAQGVVSVQADCTVDEALRMLLERAQVSHRSLTQIANDVVAHRIWFC
jgi:AmiR/NasT family two-component response regulator